MTGRDHAIVVGAGIAGLAAAGVLAERFERVTVVERDDPANDPAPRAGAPQALHQHALLVGGRLVLERLFPGFGDDLLAAGAEPVDLAQDVAWLTPAGWARRAPSDLMILACSRALLEAALRARVSGPAALTFATRQDVRGLLPRPGGGGVAGIRLAARGERGAGVPLRADLVVDASGRGSRTPAWLRELGYPSPQEIIVRSRVSYASRIFSGGPCLPAGLKGAVLRGDPPAVPRGGVIMPMEGERTMVTLVGRSGDRPPTDEAGFLDFARRLRRPLLYDAIAEAKPLSPIVGSRTSDNRLRRYERLARWPDGLVVLGDAACAFNPVYQQGMTVAALGAATLAACLDDGVGNAADTALARRFQRALARVNTEPWKLAAGQDARSAGSGQVRRRRRGAARSAYLREVSRLGAERAGAHIALLRVLSMVEPFSALWAPRIAVAVLGRSIRRVAGARTGVRRPAPDDLNDGRSMIDRHGAAAA